MKTISSVVLLALGLSMSGCAAIDKVSHKLGYETGVQVTAAQMKTFTDGKTTQKDVIKAIGHPMRKEMIRSTEAWYYDYTYIAPLPGQANTSEATVFEFNSKGILKSHYKTAAKSQDPLSKAAGI
ncbi:hypothetical protein [Gallaecimonas mangrovi]|uniref:hypothetical protein n=1 Tax=Gallaecimonas mangrovi TaxID=2291597 RepID=UPI000E200722|nr:hypothetical protein [Gallaecimonas mangrovi]